MRGILFRCGAVALLALPGAMPHAFAISKDMLQLQTQMSQLQDMVQHLQTSNDENMGAIKNLVQQNNDSVNRMMTAMSALQNTLKMETDQRGSTNTQLSTQIQALNDSVDELKTRVANLSTQLQGMQGASPAAPQPGGAPPPPTGAAMNQLTPPAGASQAPPVDQIYQGALRDYNSAKYQVAASEFGDVIHYYPQDPLAGNAQYYLGEIAYRQSQYAAAVKSYDAVLEQYSGNSKAPAAQLRKGQSLIAMGQKDAGVRELRALIGRYPNTPEALEGRSKLNGMGVRIVSNKPSAYPTN